MTKRTLHPKASAKRSRVMPARESRLADLHLLAVNHSIGKFLQFSYTECTINPDGSIQFEPGDVMVVKLTGDQYVELFKANPEWAPGKPAGIYREEDLFLLEEYLGNHPEIAGETL